MAELGQSEVVTIQMGRPVLHADVIYRWSLFDPRERTALTCRDDVVDAGDDLPAHQVGRPAQHRPVVHLRARRVRQQAGRALEKDVHLLLTRVGLFTKSENEL